MDIEELLNKYFEGETTAAEEKTLRRFFAGRNVPDNLAVYKPLFGYFDQEIAKQRIQLESPQKKIIRHLYWFSGAAACIIAAVIVGKIYLDNKNPCSCSGNYVVINGRCYTDPDKVHSMALVALREVATTPDEYMPLMEDDTSDDILIKNQLKELGNILSDQE